MSTVNVYVSEEDLEAAVGGTVTTFADEAALEVGLNAAASPDYILNKGAKFTVLDSPTIINVVEIVAKGNYFQVTTDP